MKSVLSPKELGQAVGASESSIKRWIDDGMIAASRTAGGHRRVAIAEAIRFIRASRLPVVHPEILGLRDVDAETEQAAAGDEAEALFEYLLRGKAREARGLVMSLYLSGKSVAEIADGPIRAAMHRLGELWKHDSAGIYVEHRATDICIQSITQLRLILDPPAEGPVALGGAPEGDPYLAPSMIAATVLMSEGFRAVNLGGDTPVGSLIVAAERHKPVLVWLSITSARAADKLKGELPRLHEALSGLKVPLILGGQARPRIEKSVPADVYQASTMAELLAFAKGFATAGAGSVRNEPETVSDKA